MTDIDPTTFIQQHTYGILSSHSRSEPGYPFGSLTPYIVTPQGQIAIYISHLAEHTKNIQADPKVALTISQLTDYQNPPALPRLTCLADAQPVTQSDTHLRQRYLQCFPDSQLILDLPGFQFYFLILKRIRLVAGFGQARWLDAQQLTLSSHTDASSH